MPSLNLDGRQIGARSLGGFGQVTADGKIVIDRLNRDQMMVLSDMIREAAESLDPVLKYTEFEHHLSDGSKTKLNIHLNSVEGSE